jgi:hypothetical protein
MLDTDALDTIVCRAFSLPEMRRYLRDKWVPAGAINYVRLMYINRMRLRG